MMIYVPCVALTGSGNPLTHLHTAPLALQGFITARSNSLSDLE